MGTGPRHVLGVSSAHRKDGLSPSIAGRLDRRFGVEARGAGAAKLPGDQPAECCTHHATSRWRRALLRVVSTVHARGMRLAGGLSVSHLQL
jgi:hypothetical protein